MTKKRQFERSIETSDIKNFPPGENAPADCRGVLNIPAVFISSSPEETFAIGENFSNLLEKCSIAAFFGPLGSGKTCFIKGIARGLGIAEEITSPTFGIILEYSGTLKNGNSVKVYHIDAYRLRGNDDFYAIGGEEAVFGNGISIIEWSENIPDFIAPHAFRIEIEIKSADKRLIRIYGGQPPMEHK